LLYQMFSFMDVLAEMIRDSEKLQKVGCTQGSQ